MVQDFYEFCTFFIISLIFLPKYLHFPQKSIIFAPDLENSSTEKVKTKVKKNICDS